MIADKSYMNNQADNIFLWVGPLVLKMYGMILEFWERKALVQEFWCRHLRGSSYVWFGSLIKGGCQNAGLCTQVR